MIGNDIVDLALAQKESNWKRKGFLDKIFTLQEQLFINLSENQEIEVWNNKKYEDHFDVILSTGGVNGTGGARCTDALKKEDSSGEAG